MSTVAKVMCDVFPELKQHEVRIRDIIAEEEASFGKTLLKVSKKPLITQVLKLSYVCASWRDLWYLLVIWQLMDWIVGSSLGN